MLPDPVLYVLARYIEFITPETFEYILDLYPDLSNQGFRVLKS